jgi:hypothetical protein
VQARVQVLEIFLKPCRVLLPCDAIDARRRRLLQGGERRTQSVDIDVV